MSLEYLWNIKNIKYVTKPTIEPATRPPIVLNKENSQSLFFPVFLNNYKNEKN